MGSTEYVPMGVPEQLTLPGMLLFQIVYLNSLPEASNLENLA